MTPLEKLGGILFKFRDYTPIPIVIAALLFADPTVLSLTLGFLVALFGEIARTYGVAFIGTISRTRSATSNGQLVQEGPFSLLRNPLYFGNLILSLGLSIMPGIAILPWAVVLIFYVQYIPIVLWEEQKLRGIFGQSYIDYCQKVPNRWFPSLAGLFKGGWFVQPDSWAPALKSEKRTLTSFLAFVAVMLGLMLWQQNSEGQALPLVRYLFP